MSREERFLLNVLCCAARLVWCRPGGVVECGVCARGWPQEAFWWQGRKLWTAARSRGGGKCQFRPQSGNATPLPAAYGCVKTRQLWAAVSGGLGRLEIIE